MSRASGPEPAPRFDLRYEYIRQDQPMTGSRKIAVGEIHRHHDEVLTRNNNWIGHIDYPLSADWAINAMLPLVDREHVHIHNHGGAQIRSLGLQEAGRCARPRARRLATAETSEPTLGMAGVNFVSSCRPDGPTVRNAEGELAERPLQPGTGTTDALAGVYYTRILPARNLSWFAQAMLQLPLNYHEDYKPGKRLSLDAGLRYGVGDNLGLMRRRTCSFAATTRRPGGAGGYRRQIGLHQSGVSYARDEKRSGIRLSSAAVYQT